MSHYCQTPLWYQPDRQDCTLKWFYAFPSMSGLCKPIWGQCPCATMQLPVSSAVASWHIISFTAAWQVNMWFDLDHDILHDGIQQYFLSDKPPPVTQYPKQYWPLIQAQTTIGWVFKARWSLQWTKLHTVHYVESASQKLCVKLWC